MVVLKSDPAAEYSEFSDDSLSALSSSTSTSSSSQPETDSSYSVYKYDEVPENKSWASTIPTAKGLYNPEYEKDNCGVGMYPSHLYCFLA